MSMSVIVLAGPSEVWKAESPETELKARLLLTLFGIGVENSETVEAARPSLPFASVQSSRGEGGTVGGSSDS